MAAAIAMGIAVDDTLHFMLRYNQELRTSKSQALAMQKTILRRGPCRWSRPRWLLTVGFLVFAQSGLLPRRTVRSAQRAGHQYRTGGRLRDHTAGHVAAAPDASLWGPAVVRLRHQIIPRSPLFRGCARGRSRKFVLSSTLLEFNAGDYVLPKDDDSNALYPGNEGVVEIRPAAGANRKAGTRSSISSVRARSSAMALLANEARKTNAVA